MLAIGTCSMSWLRVAAAKIRALEVTPKLLKVRRTKRDDHIKPLTQYSEQHVGVHKQSRRFQIRLKKHNCLELIERLGT